MDGILVWASHHIILTIILIVLIVGGISDSIRKAIKNHREHQLALTRARHPAPMVLAPPPGQQAPPELPARAQECPHFAPNVKAVLDEISGERQAWLCLACDTQLPAEWAISPGETTRSTGERTRKTDE
jgi:hypothetical protein